MADVPKAALDMSQIVTGAISLVSTGVGFMFSQIAEWVKDRRVHSRETETRRFATRDKQYDRRNEFQRQTLLSLQEEVAKNFGCVNEMHARRKIANEDKTGWPDIIYPFELSDRTVTSNAQVQMFSVRVRDESIRSMFGHLRTHMGSVVLATSREAANNALVESKTAFTKLNERIGEVLRELDSEEPVD